MSLDVTKKTRENEEQADEEVRSQNRFAIVLINLKKTIFNFFFFLPDFLIKCFQKPQPTMCANYAIAEISVLTKRFVN